MIVFLDSLSNSAMSKMLITISTLYAFLFLMTCVQSTAIEAEFFQDSLNSTSDGNSTVTMPTNSGNSSSNGTSTLTMPTNSGNLTAVTSSTVTVPTGPGNSTAVENSTVTMPTNSGNLTAVTSSTVTVPTGTGNSTAVGNSTVTMPTNSGNLTAVTSSTVTLPTGPGNSTAVGSSAVTAPPAASTTDTPKKTCVSCAGKDCLEKSEGDYEYCTEDDDGICHSFKNETYQYLGCTPLNIGNWTVKCGEKECMYANNECECCCKSSSTCNIDLLRNCGESEATAAPRSSASMVSPSIVLAITTGLSCFAAAKHE